MRSQKLLDNPSDLCQISNQVPKLDLELPASKPGEEQCDSSKSPKAPNGIRTSDQEDGQGLDEFGLDCSAVDQSRIWTFEEQFRQLYEIDTDPERKKFLDELFAFMQKRGTPVNRIPIMAKQTLDLHLLFKLVVSKGGLVEVINRKLWREITKGLNLPHSITSAAFTLRTQYMKYLYPFECEKHNLSTIEELNAAIDGNRRDSRNIQSPPTSPGLGANPFGLPFGQSFNPTACFDPTSQKFGLFGFHNPVNAINIPAPNGLLQTPPKVQGIDEKNRLNFNLKPSATPSDLLSQSALAAFRAKFFSSLQAGQYLTPAATAPGNLISLPPVSANNTATGMVSSAQQPAIFSSQIQAASNSFTNDILSQRMALAQNQHLAVMQAAAFYEQQQMNAIENLRKHLAGNNNETQSVETGNGLKNPPETLSPTNARTNSMSTSSAENAPASNESHSSLSLTPPLENNKRTLENKGDSPPCKRRILAGKTECEQRAEVVKNEPDEIKEERVAIGKGNLRPENVCVKFVNEIAENEISIIINVDGKNFEGTLKIPNTSNTILSVTSLSNDDVKIQHNRSLTPLQIVSSDVTTPVSSQIRKSPHKPTNFHKLASEIAGNN